MVLMLYCILYLICTINSAGKSLNGNVSASAKIPDIIAFPYKTVSIGVIANSIEAGEAKGCWSSNKYLFLHSGC